MCNSNAKATRETKTNTGTTMNDTHKIGNRSKYKTVKATDGHYMQSVIKVHVFSNLKVHKIENFFDSDFGICVISLLVMSKY